MILKGKGALHLLKDLFPDKESICPFIRSFTDGEIDMRFFSEVEFLVQSCYPNPNKRILELLLMAKLAKDPFIALVPYLAYSRQALLLEFLLSFLATTGIKKLVTIDLHQEYEFMQPWIVNLETTDLLLDLTYNYELLVAPDKGAESRLNKLAARTGHEICYCHKKRLPGEGLQLELKTNNVKGKNCLIIDDLLATGETINQTTKKLLAAGATSVSAFVTHTLLNKNSLTLLEKTPLEKFYTTDSIKNSHSLDCISLISITPLLKNYLLNERQ